MYLQFKIHLETFLGTESWTVKAAKELNIINSLPIAESFKIYGNIVLPVVLHVCETWSLTLGEERKLRVFENRVLRKIFGPKRDEVT
jgi:hypothetical protein